jgi:hypothetical protein
MNDQSLTELKDMLNRPAVKSIIPADVLLRIQQKKLAREAEQRLEKESQEAARQEHKAQGKAMVDEYIASALQDVPEWIWTYLDMTDHELDYVRFANKWDRLTSIDLYFSIPGLSEIAYNTEKKQWRATEARWREYEDDDPWLSYGNAYWRSDLDYVLLVAKEQMELHQANVVACKAKKDQKRIEAAQAYEAEQKREAAQAEANEQAELKAELKAQQEQADELALFESLRTDAFALHLLKAFVLVQKERWFFEQRIEEADQSMYSIEDYWSRKASELRSQAADAERRAEEEKSRLQSDLDNAEAKLKKVQRSY